MIAIKNLRKAFNDNVVLRDVNAEISKGEIISVIGPHGSGKSTFLRCMNLLEKPDGGKIIVGTENILMKHFNPIRIRSRMGMVSQSIDLFPHLMAVENIMLAPSQLSDQPKQKIYDRAMELLDIVGLTSKAYAFPEELSDGQKQRISIARTLAMNPEILLVDDPTGVLDSSMVNEVLAVIRKIAQTGITMLIATHEIRFARDISSRVFYLDEGIIYEEGSPEVIFKKPVCKKTYAFIKGINMYNAEILKKDFDLYHFLCTVDDFVEKQTIPLKRRIELSLYLEEFVRNVLFATASKVNIAIGVSDEDNSIEINAEFDGPDRNPLDSVGHLGETSRKILAKYARGVEYQHNSLKIIL